MFYSLMFAAILTTGCGTADEAREVLKEKFGETPQAVYGSNTPESKAFIMFKSLEDNTWTFTVYFVKTKTVCLLAAGTGWSEVRVDPRKKEPTTEEQ